MTIRNKKKCRTPVRPLCPVHGTQMLVRCVVGRVQYRYCRVAGCHESVQTIRRLRRKRRIRKCEEASTASVSPP